MHFEYNIAHEIFNVILAFIWIAFLLLVLKPKHGIFSQSCVLFPCKPSRCSYA